MEDTMARPAKEKLEKKEWFPSATDRCDAECPAQAMVLLRGVLGELYFCHHHYQVLMSSDASREKLVSFSFEIQDYSYILEDNRSKGANL